MSRKLRRARPGDVIRAAALRHAVDRLVELAGDFCDTVSDNCTFPEQRQIMRRAHSLLNLSVWLDGGLDIALKPGQPAVQAAHVNDAIDYAVHAFRRTGALPERLALVDLLLDFFQAVLGGEGSAIVAAAQALKHGADATQPAPPAYHLADFRSRAWEAAQYVLLPVRGLRSPALAALQQTVQPAPLALARSTPAAARVSAAVAAMPPAASAPMATPQILHSTHDDGPKLASLTDGEVLALKASAPGVRVLPLVIYELARRPLLQLDPALQPKQPALKLALTLQVVREGSSDPVPGAHVIAFTSFEQRAGAEGSSDAGGMVKLDLQAPANIEILVVYGPHGYWGLYRAQLKLAKGQVLGLKPIDLSADDYLAQLYGGYSITAGKGVTVGVIDTGIDGTHPDLAVAGGAAFVLAESDAGGSGPAAVDGDHGTHVAGIIASHGAAPSGKRGVAPAATLMSYRVFPNAGGGATNYDIIRAIDRAVTDGCDLLNLSLGGSERDEAVREAIKDAFDKGVLCFAATGNDGRGPVNYPARWPDAVAVSAIGRRSTFPDDSSEALDVQQPYSPQDEQVFVAGFSNVGPEVDLAGPGVGIVSTVPGGAYGVMSGTSMACPAIVGAAAALLAKHPKVLAMARDGERSLAMLRLVNGGAASLGFGRDFEGLGLLR
jgi:subtilisin